MKRRAQFPLTSLCLLFSLVGCTSSLLRPDYDQTALEELTRDDANLISKFTHPYGLDYVKVEAISLATGLKGTGGDPPPSPQRAALLSEMQIRDVPEPQKLLSSKENSLVLIRGFLRPGIREGERFDVEVRVPSRSETTSLRNGWVLPARMTELAVLGGEIRSGHVLATSEGAILVDPSADGEADTALATRGRILGGGVAKRSRQLGLEISQDYANYRRAKDISEAINDRFYVHRDGRRTGVAEAKKATFVELFVHDRYAENLTRYIRVIRNIAVNEDPATLQTRIQRLSTQLNDPLTSATAAIRLEAIGGEQAVDILKQAAQSSDPEVSFYSAEALAYLDDTSAVEILAQVARQEPAFRVNALAALSAMDDIVAYDALRSLLSVTSAETRYGAFRALWSMNANDPLVRGEQLNQFSYHQLDVDGPSMVHVTRSFRPEIVLFGNDLQFELPMVLDAGKDILVNGMTSDQVTISRFLPNESTPQKRVVNSRVDEVVRAIVDLGGTYPDVVQALQQAKRDGALTVRLGVDELPEVGRDYDSKDDDEVDLEEAGAAPYKVATPLPDLFSRKK